MRQSLSTNRHFSESQSATIEDMHLYRNYYKLDLITIFILMPPELMTTVDMVCKYYRCFNVPSKPLRDDLVLEFLNEDLKNLLGLMQ